MAFTGFGPDITFLGVPRCELDDVSTYADADIVILGAPLDGGTNYRSGTRFGPSALRQACYLPQDDSRPSLALRVDGLKELRVYDAGDVEFHNGHIEQAVELIEAAVFKISSAGAIPIILGGDHTIAWPDHTGVARRHGFGKVSMIHFDAHADTGDIHLGSLVGHGTPMRRLIESGALRGDRFLQLGLRGYWPDEPVLQWMAAHGLRSYEMTEIVARGLETCLTEAFQIATSECEGVFLSVDIDVCDPGHAPGSYRSSGSTSSRFLPRTITRTLPRCSEIVLCWRRFRRSPDAGRTRRREQAGIPVSRFWRAARLTSSSA
jgi:agmatinase